VAAAVLIAAILRATSATAGLSLVLHASFPRLLPDTSDVRRLSTACAQMLARAAP
jgi:hypothetical protein